MQEMKSEVDNKKSFYRNEKDYMNSYFWNYMTLELVDYIEINLKSAAATAGQNGTKNKWRYFMQFCAERGLNRRVIRKMIEFSVGQSFECEADLANNEAFRSLKNGECKIPPATANDDCQIPTATKAQQIPMANANCNFDVLDDIF
jgi:hypothetical protein